MSWPFKDYDYYGDRYINIEDPNSTLGERMWYNRDINIESSPTECEICIEAENELFTKYAHPKAHLDAHTQASINAGNLVTKKKTTEDYIEFYTFYYGREYKRIYMELYKKYKEEYYKIVLEKTYDKDNKICQYHLESIQYHYELNLENK
jgi:hypothetical protein